MPTAINRCAARHAVVGVIAAAAVLVAVPVNGATVRHVSALIAGATLTMPSGARANPSVTSRDVACSGPGDCSAVGIYYDSSGRWQGFTASETNGTWSRAATLVPPPGAGTDPYTNPYGLDCTGPGNCTAAGYYTDAGAHVEAFGITQVHGAWAAASMLVLPGGARADPGTSISGLACATASDCAAVGTYYDTSSARNAVVFDRVAGTWQAGVELTMPNNANASAAVYPTSVACPSAGGCVAAGNYQDASGDTRGFLANEVAGVWASAVELQQPADGSAAPNINVYPNAVSCASTGHCTAVGNYADISGHTDALAATESGGTWSQGVKVAAPANAAVDPLAGLTSVSCRVDGSCSAVGDYGDSASHAQVFVAAELAGTWSVGTELTLPQGVATSPSAYAASVSCSSIGNCLAVGYYADAVGAREAFGAREQGGTWQHASEVQMPHGAAANPEALLQQVSCYGRGDCSAVGTYVDAGSNQLGLTVRFALAPTVDSITPKQGPAAGGTNVTVHGANFLGASSVRFGTRAGTHLVVVSATTLHVLAPSGSGVKPVTVTTPGGTSATTSGLRFTYLPAPMIRSVSPGRGTAHGGTRVTIRGINFAGTTTILFGTRAGTHVVVVSPDVVTVTTPSGHGVVTVRVRAHGGTSVPTSASRFRYT